MRLETSRGRRRIIPLAVDFAVDRQLREPDPARWRCTLSTVAARRPGLMDGVRHRLGRAALLKSAIPLTAAQERTRRGVRVRASPAAVQQVRRSARPGHPISGLLRCVAQKPMR
jgi:hypothetical protein